MVWYEIQCAFVAFILACLVLVVFGGISGCGPDKERCYYEFSKCVREVPHRCEIVNYVAANHKVCDKETFAGLMRECHRDLRLCQEGVPTYGERNYTVPQ